VARAAVDSRRRSGVHFDAMTSWTELGDGLQAAAAGLGTLGDRALAPLGVTVAQGRVLAALEAGPMRVSDLVRALRHDQAAVSRLAGRLQAVGLVRRVPVDGDRRSAQLRLTTRGQQAARDSRRRLAALLGRLTEDLSRRERSQLEGLLGRRATRVRAACGDPGP